MRAILLSVCIALISGCATYSDVRDSQDQAKEYYRTAGDLYKQHRYNEAEKYMTMAIEKLEQAVTRCHIAVDCVFETATAPLYAELYANRAWIRAAAGKFILAIKDAREALSYDESNARAHAVLGYCSTKTGDFDTASRELNKLKRLDKQLAANLEAWIADAKMRGMKIPIPKEAPLRMNKELQGNHTLFIKKE